MEPPKRHIHTSFRVIAEKDFFKIHEYTQNIMRDWEIMAENVVLCPNYSMAYYSEIEKFSYKYFILDHIDTGYDKKTCKTKPLSEMAESGEMWSSMTACGKHHERNLYLRLLPPAAAGTKGDNRIFLDDVLEIIPLILRKQAPKIDYKIEEKLENLKSQASKESHIYDTITVAELNEVFQHFDWDKSKLTLVDDPISIITRNEMQETFGYVRTCAPDSVEVMDQIQAVFFTFHCFVNGVNWKKNDCEKHEWCLLTLRERIIKLMKKFAYFKKGCYIRFSYILEEFKTLQKECPDIYIKKRITLDYAFQDFLPNDCIPMYHYKNVCALYDLEPKARTSDKELQVWKARLLLQSSWIDQFFPDRNKDTDIRPMLDNSLFFFISAKDNPGFIESLAELLYGKSALPAPNAPPGIEKPSVSEDSSKMMSISSTTCSTPGSGTNCLKCRNHQSHIASAKKELLGIEENTKAFDKISKKYETLIITEDKNEQKLEMMRRKIRQLEIRSANKTFNKELQKVNETLKNEIIDLEVQKQKRLQKYADPDPNLLNTVLEKRRRLLILQEENKKLLAQDGNQFAEIRETVHSRATNS
ncbi:hypothetical protein GCK72_010898 [Caenorhabditis remanei]|uniref:Uncharacterized protein n=1 Tax=Caenorhabditis remanei TaxID=31234 RepID=A0A6A5H6Z8_CAERE|nr:hypothetical protein GCK72_010898 [Caenorhabditis remanei]KAF1762636.1 hypothetical protein GCK72_010898 [Caenorhabditis remanei]